GPASRRRRGRRRELRPPARHPGPDLQGGHPVTTPTSPALSTGSAVWLVTEREIGSKLRSKAFIISSAILFIAALAGVIWAGSTAADASGTPVAVTQDAASYVAETPGLDPTTVADRAAAEELVTSGDVEAAIVADPDSPVGF